MNHNLENSLKSKFPQLLADMDYLDVGDGWGSIIENMCFLIQNDYKLKSMENPLTKQPKFVQIKQKFGGLRAYLEYSSQNEYANAVIDMAEKMSCCTCEFCGNAGSEPVILRSWITNLCKNCRKENLGE